MPENDDDEGELSSRMLSVSSTPVAKRSRKSPLADDELLVDLYAWTPDKAPFTPINAVPEPDQRPPSPDLPAPHQPEADQRPPPPDLAAPRPPPPAATTTILTSSLPMSWQAGLVDQDRQDLLCPAGWLTGAIINMALDAITSAGVPRHFPVTTDVITATARADNHPAYTQRLYEHDILLLPLHICGNHWALASLDRKTKAVSVYDSMASTMHEEAAEAVISQFLSEFLGEDAYAWNFTTGASPQQSDTSSCGVFALVTAVYLLSARTIPVAPYHVKMWRLVLAYLVAPESAYGEAIWPYSTVDDRQSASVAIANSPEVAALQQQLISGTCSVQSAMDLTEKIHDAARRTVTRMKIAACERRRAMTEVQAIDALLMAARAVGDRRPLARMLVDRLAPCVAQAMTDGAASVAFFRQQIETAEVRLRGRTTA